MRIYFLHAFISLTKHKPDSTEKVVKKASDHSNVDMFVPAFQFTGIMSTDEINTLIYKVNLRL